MQGQIGCPSLWRGIKHVWRKGQQEKKAVAARPYQEKRKYMPRKKTGMEPGYRTGRPRVYADEITAQVQGLLLQGLTVRATAEKLRLAKSTVHRMSKRPAPVDSDGSGAV